MMEIPGLAYVPLKYPLRVSVTNLKQIQKYELFFDLAAEHSPEIIG